MRLGKKKEKDREMEKEQFVEGVARLICSPKQSHPVPMRGKIFFVIELFKYLIELNLIIYLQFISTALNGLVLNFSNYPPNGKLM